ncbi:hypothetical protein JRC04_17335 [Mycolicibacterium sp. S2-37]|uniref:Ig-like domain-containing protein n=1 Tax=Mycolicibacterium sp. S2-37 TaxID=2810297 RepID=UPI001A94788F|nr:Ig-like domain-containing protein [Mycolicibacterium sp. S2-37]MBO0679231.1 hypothetical protein [Mycolicibacterium sp. S2-37]
MRSSATTEPGRGQVEADAQTEAEPSDEPETGVALRRASRRTPSESVETARAERATEVEETGEPRLVTRHSGPAGAQAPEQDAVITITDAAPAKRSIATTAAYATADESNDVVAQLASVRISNPTARATATAPPTPSWATMLQSLRQFIEQTLITQVPTASPRQAPGLQHGAITGTLGAQDRTGNPLTFTVNRQPNNGTVTIDGDGNYRYTPNEALATTGGTDTFTVDISNGARSLFVRDATGLHLNWFQERTVSVPVSVTVTAAPTSPGSALPGSQGGVDAFYVINLTSRALRFNGYTEDDGAYGPKVGDIIQPGQEMQINLAGGIGVRRSLVATFNWVGDQGSYAYGIYATQSGLDVQDANCWGGPCYVREGWAIYLQDQPNTTHTIDAAAEPAKAREALLQLCNGGRASCDFTPTSEEKTWGRLFELTRVSNGGTVPITQEISESRTATQSDSIEISAEASSKLSDLINTRIAAKYGHSWTTSQTMSYKLTVPVPAGGRIAVWAGNPVNRVHGTFTIRMGNTTWTISNVYFDTPDATRLPSFEIRPITTATRQL